MSPVDFAVILPLRHALCACHLPVNGAVRGTVKTVPYAHEMKFQGKAGVIPLLGEMSAKQTKGFLNSENLPPRPIVILRR